VRKAHGEIWEQEGQNPRAGICLHMYMYMPLGRKDKSMQTTYRSTLSMATEGKVLENHLGVSFPH
jgi:hypothetical protein